MPSTLHRKRVMCFSESYFRLFVWESTSIVPDPVLISCASSSFSGSSSLLFLNATTRTWGNNTVANEDNWDERVILCVLDEKGA